MANLTLTITDADGSSADLVNAMGRTNDFDSMNVLQNQLASFLAGSRRGRVRVQWGTTDRTFNFGPSGGATATVTLIVPETDSQLGGILRSPAAQTGQGVAELMRYLAGVNAGVADARVTSAINAFTETFDEGERISRQTYTMLESNASSYYIGGAGDGPDLTGGASTVGILWRFTTVPNTDDHTGIRKLNPGTRGYRLEVQTGTNALLQARVQDGATNRLKQDDITCVQDELHAAVMRFNTNGSNYELNTYFDNNTPIGSATSWTAAYTPPTTEQLIIAAASPGGSSEGGLVAVVVANAVALTEAQIGAWMTQVKAGGALSFPEGTTHLWDAADAGSTWVDQISGLSLTKTGTVTPTSFTATHA